MSTNKVEVFRRKAIELREAAYSFSAPDHREQMLKLARDYEDLADIYAREAADRSFRRLG